MDQKKKEQIQMLLLVVAVGLICFAAGAFVMKYQADAAIEYWKGIAEGCKLW